MATSLRLESLPLEILAKIFVASTNPDLPFVSRHLLAQLSGAHLHKRLAISMLLSDDAATQSNLLRRRFLDLAVFDAATRAITPPCKHDVLEKCPRGFNYSLLTRDSWYIYFQFFAKEYAKLNPDLPHFMFARGISIGSRLLCNFEAAAAAAAPTNLLPGRFWKMELMRRVLASSAEDFFTPTPQPYSISYNADNAPRQGLLEAIRAANVDAIELLTIQIAENCWPFAYPSREWFKFAVVDMDCADKDVVVLLYNPRHWDGDSDCDLERWIDARREEDSQLRCQGPKYIKDGVEVAWEDLWVGDWIHDLYREHSYRDYDEFVSSQAQKNLTLRAEASSEAGPSNLR